MHSQRGIVAELQLARVGAPGSSPQSSIFTKLPISASPYIFCSHENGNKLLSIH